MDKKPLPFIPAESLKSQRVEVYINDLQKRLHQLRNKYDTIFIECCDILKNIQEVSTETMTKQQEIGRIIREFEEIGLKNSSKDNVLKKALIQKAGDVKRLREKFETIFQQNLHDYLVTSKSSNYEVEKNYIQYSVENAAKPDNPNMTGGDQEQEESLSTMESFYSVCNEPSQHDTTQE